MTENGDNLWDSEFECRASTLCTADFDGAAVGFHEPFGNGQPQPASPGGAGPGFIQAVKPLEYLRQIFLRYAFSRIAYGDCHAF